MKNIVNLLKHQYKELTNEKNDWHFFIKLADYTIFLKETKEIRNIIEKFSKRKNDDYEKFLKVKDECTKELSKAEKDVIKIIKSNRLENKNQRIERAIKELDSYKKGTLTTSESKPYFLHRKLFDIGIGLAELNKKKLLGKYNKDNTERKNIYGNFVFSEKLKEYKKEEESLKSNEKISYWNAWEKLNLVWFVLYKKDELLKKAEEGNPFLNFNVFALFDEMNQIEKSYRQPFEERKLFYNFIKEHYNLYLSRLHNFLLKELNKKQQACNVENRETLNSMYLITERLTPSKTIFLVFDKKFNTPIRFNVKNNKNEDTYIKKLHDIVYPVLVPNKKVLYNRNLVNNINNAIFKKKKLKEYLKNKDFKKPTLVGKSEDGEIVVLKNEVCIEVKLIKNIPDEHKHLYLDKIE